MVLTIRYLIPIGIMLLILGAVKPRVSYTWDGNTPVQEVLAELGEPDPSYGSTNLSPTAIQQGKDFVLNGSAIGPNGKRTPYISKHFLCTHCHNIAQEDPDLRSRDPQARLDYAIENQLPFLQGTTFHGIVNRESWYNDDYYKKYGEPVKRANKDLRASIQLCAVQCSQGRKLKDWEIDAILAYYGSLSFKMGELDFSGEELARLQVEANDPAQSEELIALVKSKYLQTSPAHFSDAPPDKRAGYDFEGDAQRGMYLYKLSCLHCHEAGSVSSYILDQSSFSFKHLKKKIPQDSHFSLYQIIRYGTYSLPGHRPYMPHYPLERMNHQQVEDLRAYVEFMAE